MLHPQRVFLHLKKCHDMSSEGCAIHPVSHNSLLQIKMAISRIIFKFELAALGAHVRKPAVWRTSNLKKSAPNSH
jgi:hypothetical protein